MSPSATASEKRYTVVSTRPETYLDSGRKVVNGVAVEVMLNDYDETHTLRLPSMDLPSFKKAVEKLLADRDALAAL